MKKIYTKDSHNQKADALQIGHEIKDLITERPEGSEIEIIYDVGEMMNYDFQFTKRVIFKGKIESIKLTDYGKEYEKYHKENKERFKK